ncbi:MAG: hypothetical protein IKV38_04045 [Clostridia bacterium]|nr:hypothetical protein [Clostridia bacterium]
MFLKKTFSLVGSNYVTHLKSLAFQVLLIALVVALFGLFFADFGTTIVNAVTEEKLIAQAQNLLADLVNWSEHTEREFLRDLDNFVNSIVEIVSSIPDFFNRIILAVWFLLVAVYCTYFFTGMIQFANSYCINQFMTSNVRSIYSWVFFKGFKEGAKISAISALYAMFLDIAILMTSIGSYVVFFSSWGAWGVLISIFLFMVLICLRKSLFAYLLPIYVNNNYTLKPAMKENMSFVFDNFHKVFLNTLIIGAVGVILALAFLAIFKVVVVAVILTLFISFMSYVLTCNYFVSFYQTTKKSYFVKKVKIAVLEDGVDNFAEQ